MADDLKPESLYDRDFVAWTEAQAAALRARRQGANALDYDNLAEEIEDLGKSETNACFSFVDLIIEHLLKIQFVGGRDVPHWRGEVRNFRRDLSRRITATIRNQLLDQLGDANRAAIVVLLERELGASESEVHAALPKGYVWDQIVDPEWYPEPRA